MNALPPNTLLQNRYLIVRMIGQGGMGAVYEAQDQRLGNRVALKQTIVSRVVLQRAFKREARLLAQLRHSALPNVIDYFIEPTGQFLVMEYISGLDLEKLHQQQGGPFSITEVLKWADQLLNVLEYLHSHQPPVIHRDIKPSNIKLSSQGQIILLDFGISKGGNPKNSRLTMGGTSLHAFTPNYAPLEQIEGTGTDPRSDLYSLGTTLYYLATGATLPTAMTRARAQIGHRSDPLRLANELNPRIPVAVANVLAQAMQLDPEQRFDSAKAMRFALRQAMQPAKPLTSSALILGAKAKPGSLLRQTGRRAALYPEDSPPQTTQGLARQIEPPKPAPEPEASPKSRPARKLPFKLLGTLSLIAFTLAMILGMLIMYNKQPIILASVSQPAAPISEDNVESVRQLSQTNMKRHLSEWGARASVSEVIWSSDGQFFAIAAKDIWLYQMANLDEVMVITTQNPFATVTFNPDGTTIASWDESIQLWDTQSGTLRDTREGSAGWVNDVAFSPDNTILASGFGNSTIKLWQTGTDTQMGTFEGHSDQVLSIAFSPDGTTLASGSIDHTVKLWDVASGTLITTLEGHEEWIKSVAFSPDGTILASASRDHTIKLWDVASGTLRGTLIEHSDDVTDVAFSPDGSHIASASWDTTIKLWHMASATRKTTLEGHDKRVNSVVFSPDGKLLASGSEDGTVRMWGVP